MHFSVLGLELFLLMQEFGALMFKPTDDTENQKRSLKDFTL